jgi:RNA polymerase sigma-70 factor (ECF subfamily)
MNDESGYIQFLAAARAGDRVGMGRLAVLVWERLYPFVFRMTQSRDATEDIIQETLLTMLRRLSSLRDGRCFWSWIYRIAWNRIQDRVRSRRLQALHKDRPLRKPGATAEGCPHGSGVNDPLDTLVRAESLQQVSDALTQLNDQYRDVLQLRCYEDLPYTEIAARVRTSPDQVRVRFHRAKESLKARLACCV